MLSVKEIKENMEKLNIEQLQNALLEYETDSRTSVKKLVERYKRLIENHRKEEERIYNMKEYERKYDMFEYIAGIDEVGRGPLAGPVVASAVILPKDCTILYVNDSKKLTEKRREELYDIIMEQAISVGTGVVNARVIDEINILQATYEAMRIAISKLTVVPNVLLNDAVRIPDVDYKIKQVPIIKGDAKSLSIAAASIIAKVTRDRMMKAYAEIFPGYAFESNKGYGSQVHLEALRDIGPTSIHRNTFIRGILNESNKSNTRAVGTAYEEKAVGFLIEHGCEIVENNYRSKSGEIDIIVKDKHELVFVEVKYRKNAKVQHPLEAVDNKKQITICRVAQDYMRQNDIAQDTPSRFDVIAILDSEIQWIKQAFGGL